MNSLKAILALGYIFIVIVFLTSRAGYTIFMNNIIMSCSIMIAGAAAIFAAIVMLKKY